MDTESFSRVIPSGDAFAVVGLTIFTAGLTTESWSVCWPIFHLYFKPIIFLNVYVKVLRNPDSDSLDQNARH